MKLKLVKLMAVCALALSALPIMGAETTLKPEVRSLVGECAQNPQKLKQTIGSLSADEQVEFVRAVNEAIAKMPGSSEVKGAAFYAANRAAVTGVGKDNLKAVLAEVFATVPTEYLTEINERFATELFNRSANPSHVPTDQEFVTISTNMMAVVNERCQNVEGGSVRSAFAILMLLRASGGTPADLAQTLVDQLPDAQARDIALNEWIKPAMGDGQEQSYNAMLGATSAGDEPDHAIVHQLTGPQVTEALLGDLSNPDGTAENIGGGAFRSPRVPGSAVSVVDDGGSLSQIPRAYVSSKDPVGGTSDGRNDGANPYYSSGRGSSPKGSDSNETGGSGHPGLYENQ